MCGSGLASSRAVGLVKLDLEQDIITFSRKERVNISRTLIVVTKLVFVVVTEMACWP